MGGLGGSRELDACVSVIAMSAESTNARCVPIPPEWNALTERIIGCAIEVHRLLGPGLVEKLYEAALVHELGRQQTKCAEQVAVRVPYKDIVLPEQRLDLVVADLVIVELKSVDKVANIHLAQVQSYLRATNLPLGLLINFNETRLVEGVHRRIHGPGVTAKLRHQAEVAANSPSPTAS